MTNDKRLKILFLCTGNSCRSQMAEGWAKALKSDVLAAYSAGVETHGMNLNAIKVMNEAGVDISGHRSKLLAELSDVAFDFVVTVCDRAKESCPVFPAKATVVAHSFDDPPAMSATAKSAEEELENYRRVRDEIKAYVLTLPDSLT